MNEGHSLIRVPTSAEQFLPPKPADLITEASNFLRKHWDDVKPFWKAISGESPSIHGKLSFDEAALTFEVQEIVRSNGFAALGDVPAWKLWLALRRGYKRNTGVAVHLLEKQRLQIEHHPEEYKSNENAPAEAAAEQ